MQGRNRALIDVQQNLVSPGDFGESTINRNWQSILALAERDDGAGSARASVDEPRRPLPSRERIRRGARWVHDTPPPVHTPLRHDKVAAGPHAEGPPRGRGAPTWPPRCPYMLLC